MKKFERPVLRRYDLNEKEKIVASITWNDGVMTAQWYFHQYVDKVYVDGSKGCFEMLDEHFPTATYSDALTNYNTWAMWTAYLTRFSSTVNPDTSPEAEVDYGFYKKCARTH